MLRQQPAFARQSVNCVFDKDSSQREVGKGLRGPACRFPDIREASPGNRCSSNQFYPGNNRCNG
jgi:hypothetical protein